MVGKSTTGCILFNARSLKTVNSNTHDLLSLNLYLSYKNLDIIGINKTRLDNSVSDNELEVDAFSFLYKR